MECEGWRRKGGAFTFGPVEWRRCEEKAKVMITFTQKQNNKEAPEKGELPACMTCLKECNENDQITVLKVSPIEDHDDAR